MLNGGICSKKSRPSETAERKTAQVKTGFAIISSNFLFVQVWGDVSLLQASHLHALPWIVFREKLK